MSSHPAVAAVRVWLEGLTLLPPELAAFAPLLVDGISFTLERLAPERLERIVAEQAALDPAAGENERIVTLVRAVPVLHKLGQVVARQRGLPAALRERLQTLETLPPGPAAQHVRDEIRASPQLPRGVVVGEALAEGSVAVVFAYRWENAPAGELRDGVIKALKPGARAALLADLAVWPALAAHLEERLALWALPPLDVRGTLEGIGNLLRHEIDLEREAATLGWAHAFYATSPAVVIPRIAPFSNAAFTAMERVRGTKITDERDPVRRRRLARIAVEALLAKPFWTNDAGGMRFHADPHAGNLYATDDGRLAILDWALTTTLDADDASAVIGLLAAAATFDETAALHAVDRLADVRDVERLRATLGAAIGEVRRGRTPGFAWLTPLLDRLAREGTVWFPERAALFRKSLLTVAGIVHDMAPETTIDAGVLGAALAAWLRDVPARPGAPYGSRAFATHLSNADLVDVATGVLFAPARLTLAAVSDALRCAP